MAGPKGFWGNLASGIKTLWHGFAGTDVIKKYGPWALVGALTGGAGVAIVPLIAKALDSWGGGSTKTSTLTADKNPKK